MTEAARERTDGGSDGLAAAQQGDIKAFYALYSAFKDDLRSYLYRLVADRDDADDLAQDTFVRAFDRIGTFEGRSSLKTWVFAIATHLAMDLLRHRQRWPTDVLDRAREEAIAHEEVRRYLANVHAAGPQGAFEIREHIDFCFTCISKTLVLEEQVALLLRDVYRFRTREVAAIMDTGESAVKHYVHRARRTMAQVFDGRCALVRQEGPCHQCSQLNGWFNPQQDLQQALVSIEMVRASTRANRERLLALREHLVRGINPLATHGCDLHEAFLSLHRYCAGEVHGLKPLP